MSRVLIVNMPFSNLRWPNLGPSLLKAALTKRGIGCDLAYLNFDFAEKIGLDRYTWIADDFAFVLGGERLFAKHYFGPLPDDESYFRDVLLRADPGLTEDDWRDYQAIESHVTPFLDKCMASFDWARYAVVGLATTFQQTMPSMCLARRIRQVRPEAAIVVGGAACEGTMGIELAHQFPEIDYVFLGEADLTFPSVVEQILEGRPVTLQPGVVRGTAREDTATICPGDSDRRKECASPRSPHPRPTIQAALTPMCCELASAEHADDFMVAQLDDLPYPDFDDYFARLTSSPLAGQIDPLLFFETSRGCWWGQKHQCAFCGLNGASLAFRSKSARRAVDELQWLVRRYNVRRGCMADNILDYRYFGTFLPMLKESRLGLEFVYEMKTNLTRQQVAVLLDAGLRAAQLGIETFLTPVLKHIGKGANALQNLQALKWFSEPGIEVKWNFLYGFPGEDPAEYAKLLDLLPSLYHLAPPLAVGRVRLDRFLAVFRRSGRLGHGRPPAQSSVSLRVSLSGRCARAHGLLLRVRLRRRPESDGLRRARASVVRHVAFASRHGHAPLLGPARRRAPAHRHPALRRRVPAPADRPGAADLSVLRHGPDLGRGCQDHVGRSGDRAAHPRRLARRTHHGPSRRPLREPRPADPVCDRSRPRRLRRGAGVMTFSTPYSAFSIPYSFFELSS